MGNPTDFNDLAQTAGAGAVRAVVEKALQAATNAEWPDPVLPGMVKVPEIPPSLLPAWLGNMAQAVAASTQTPPALAVMVGLSVLSTVLQRRFEVAPFSDDYTEPLALWTVSALPSGARKSAVFNAMTDPLLRWEKVQYELGRAERARVMSARKVAEKRIERLLVDAAKAKTDQDREQLRAEIQREKESMPAEVRAPRLFTEDVTAERLQTMLAEYGERMALLSDEAGIFQIMAGLYNGGSANIDAMLKGHAGTAMRVDRAGREAHVDKPSLTFGLAVQPAVLADAAASRRFRDSGLLARFLYAMPQSNVGRRDVRARVAVPPEASETYRSMIFGLLENVPAVIGKPRVLTMTAPALECWLEFAQFIEDNQGEGCRFEAISDWTSKLPGAVARIACLFELAEAGTHAEEVSQSAAERAVELGQLLIPHAQSAFGMIGADKVDIDARHILQWVRGQSVEEFSQRDCQKAMEGRFRDFDRLKKALDRLGQQDVLRHYTKRERGKRPSEMYQVNPKSLST